MVFTVRCFKCGADSVRLVLGGRAILHARGHSCSSNLLAEVLQYEEACFEPEHPEQMTQEFIADEDTDSMLETGAE